MNNDFDVETGEFVQILHNGHGHWHVISTIGVKHPTVNIFDSMYSHCSNHSKVQIFWQLKNQQLDSSTWMYKCNQARLIVDYLQLPFAATLAHGMHPGSYVFEQSLHTC